MITLLPLDRDRVRTLKSQAVDSLARAIAGGEIPAGAKLPSIRQAAIAWGLHRNSVHKIYRQLVERDLAVSKHGSGIYVK